MAELAGFIQRATQFESTHRDTPLAHGSRARWFARVNLGPQIFESRARLSPPLHTEPPPVNSGRELSWQTGAERVEPKLAARRRHGSPKGGCLGQTVLLSPPRGGGPTWPARWLLVCYFFTLWPEGPPLGLGPAPSLTRPLGSTRSDVELNLRLTQLPISSLHLDRIL